METPAQPQEYTVQTGDTINSITDQFGIGVDEFTEWNKIDNNIIYEGQRVVVGNGTASEETAPVVSTTPVETATPVENTTPVVNEPIIDNTPVLENTQVQEETNKVPEASVVTPDAVQPTPETPVQEEQAPAEVQTPEQQPEQTQPEQVQPEQTTPEQQPAPETPATSGEQQQTAPEQTTDSRGQQIVNEAEKYIGTPYVWGGKDTSGFDCSGLTQYVYKQVTGKDIGVWTVAQESSGTQISVDQAQQGDLLFWGDKGSSYHVAISAGGDQYIHAPQPGENVKYGSTQYYSPDFGVRVY
jgi:cell wall-associated NlpC family hydrolase